MTKRKRSPLWTKEEDAILFEHYHNRPMEEIVLMLPGRTKEAIWTRAGYIRLQRQNQYGQRDLSNVRFGLLVALQKTEERGSDGSIFWLCKCDCGNLHKASSNNLTRGEVQSCGCTHRRRSTEAGVRAFIRSYRTHAKNRGLEWSVSYEFVSRIIRQNCAYCGRPPEQQLISASKGIPLIYNGIDRVDPLRGYTEDNCVTCCKRCNYSKWNMSADEWIAHMRKIIAHIDSMSKP